MSAQTHAVSSHAGHDDHDEPHVLPLSVYFGVFGCLMVLTAITIGVSRFDFGSMNTVVALVVATIKGSLVALYFMHLRYDNKFNLIVLLSGILFLTIFLVPTLTDVTTRGKIEPLNNTSPAAQAAAAAAAAAGPAPAAPAHH